MDERTARMALCALPNHGISSLGRLVKNEGAVWVWESLRAQEPTSVLARRARSIDADSIAEATKRSAVRFLIPGDEEWPAELAALENATVSGQGGMPFGLWVRGVELPYLGGSVAIVGARAASNYGEHVAMEMAADLAADGRPVISGLAFGIDAAAHRGALSVGGSTVAVVASGVDRPYPAGNAALAMMIANRGTIVSELPPGTNPTRPSFLARNRLIAALASGVVVVEAALRSGAKNTAAWGNEIGRLVMAVPGPVTNTLSQTPHRLIRDGGAVLVADSRDVRELLSPVGTEEEAPRRGEDRAFDRLPQDLRLIREVLAVGEEVDAGVLAQRTGLTVSACIAGAQELTDEGWLVVGDYGRWALPTR